MFQCASLWDLNNNGTKSMEFFFPLLYYMNLFTKVFQYSQLYAQLKIFISLFILPLIFYYSVMAL